MDSLRGEIALVMPQILLAVFGLAILLTDFLLEKTHKWFNAVSALMGVGVAAYSLFQLQIIRIDKGYDSLVAFRGSIHVDSFFLFFGFLILAATALVIVLSIRYMEIEEEQHAEFYALILFATMGMLFMASGMDLVVLFLGLETMAISFYVLCGFLRRDRRSNEGALKYVLLGAFSSGLLAYGFSLLYGLSGSTNLLNIEAALQDSNTSNVLVAIALITCAAGLFFKVAAVPFHQWAPDVYEGAPTSITAYVSVASKAASFALLVRIFGSAFAPMRTDWELLFAGVALATMTVGNLAAITQNNVKRLLAYSSIAHAGYILLGVVAGNANGMQGVQFYLFAYAFMTTGAFAVVVILRRKGVIGDELEDLNGLYRRSPAAAVLLLIFMLSLAGLPPTAGFLGKYFIFLGLIQAEHYWLAVVAVLYILPALYYYFRIVRHAWMADPGEAPATQLSAGQAVVLAVTGLVTLGVGLFPQTVVDWTRNSLFFP